MNADHDQVEPIVNVKELQVLKFISFNVNGVRACVKKTLIEDLSTLNADFVCLQETKATPEQVKEALAPLTQYYVEAYGAQKKGFLVKKSAK